mmetsp:Transcript_570/g.968  ORF Transcript_570/g.968 Transcript_570/m.968 type:complete len:306 (-) Transcript_570:99-1016(-)|eukprot:CAMPEP_0185039624 /NCGR_PEP_ID=MMETSP1103-20130426/36673_1 /TAXON_ID=36769 /ORGANISM="Paraphysomonas bandaiensis, Strain Caron Lab Isolate" /LENGTH=305 /DNA_ID=CAMNT_0027578583 /DNA_START=17 /DNA_END=934 /DNA_ORIENTATION=+
MNLAENSHQYEDMPLLLDDYNPECTFHYVDEEKNGPRAVVIHNVLNENECKNIMLFMDSDQVSLESVSSNTSIRNNERAVVMSERIAKTLFDRLAPILTQLGQHELECHSSNCTDFINDGLGMKGTWELSSLNPRFRLCKYQPNGHFGPHYDGDYIIDPISHRSLKTLMIYLNDSFDGGRTCFCNDHDMHYDEIRQIYCSPDSMLYAKLKARPGDCLIFDHRILHQGEQVIGGCKYIMRSDVMYKKMNDTSIRLSTMEIEQRNLEAAAVKLYHEGTALEQNGKVDEAIIKYKRAIALYPDIEMYF